MSHRLLRTSVSKHRCGCEYPGKGTSVVASDDLKWMKGLMFILAQSPTGNLQRHMSLASSMASSVDTVSAFNNSLFTIVNVGWLTSISIRLSLEHGLPMSLEKFYWPLQNLKSNAKRPSMNLFTLKKTTFVTLACWMR